MKKIRDYVAAGAKAVVLPLAAIACMAAPVKADQISKTDAQKISQFYNGIPLKDTLMYIDSSNGRKSIKLAYVLHATMSDSATKAIQGKVDPSKVRVVFFQHPNDTMAQSLEKKIGMDPNLNRIYTTSQSTNGLDLNYLMGQSNKDGFQVDSSMLPSTSVIPQYTDSPKNVHALGTSSQYTVYNFAGQIIGKVDGKNINSYIQTVTSPCILRGNVADDVHKIVGVKK